MDKNELRAKCTNFCTNKPKVRVSAFSLAMILTTAGVLITTVCVMTITNAFSAEAAMNMAEQISNVMLEKTTLRIKGVLDRATGIASGVQAGVILSSTAMMPYEDSTRLWKNRWEQYGVTSEKALGFKAHAISFFFDDGSYVIVSGTVVTNVNGTAQRRMLIATVRGDNSPPTHVRPPANVTFYNYETMIVTSRSLAQPQIDSRLREGYNRTMVPFASSWSGVVMSFDGRVATVKLSYSVYNASKVFLGIGEVQLRLDTFDALVVEQLPTANTNVFVLDRHRNVIASSLKSASIVTNSTVAANYNLTLNDQTSGCSLVSSTNLSFEDKFLICLKNVNTFGSVPLQVMGESGLLPPVNDPYISQGVSREKLGDLGHFYIGIIDYNTYFTSLDWIAVVLIPEKEIMNDIVQGRNIAIGVSLALAFCVALVNGFLMRLFLRPLAEIVFQMQSAAYLNEEEISNATGDNAQLPGTSSEESFGQNNFGSISIEDKEKKRKLEKVSEAVEAARQLTSNRTHSYLTDVAAIQTAYWGMADELGLLKSYIPEHIRTQLLSIRQRGGSGAHSKKTRTSIDLPKKVMANSRENSFASCKELVEFDVNSPPLLVDGGKPPNASPIDNLHGWVLSTSSGVDVTSSNVSNRKTSHRHPLNGSSVSRSSETNAPQLSSEEQEDAGVTEGIPPNTFAADTHFEPSAAPVGQTSKDPLHSSSNTKTGSSTENEADALYTSAFKDDPITHSIDAPLSAKASTRQAARFASLGNLTDNNDPKALLHTFDPLPLFAENGLVERNITVALINITGFHHYVFTTETGKVVKEHEQFVSYVHEVAKRCGGVLDNFNGDKFWVSFNASTPCDEIYVAATLFAHEVATTVNGDAVSYQYYLKCSQQRSEKLPPLSPQRPRFPVALRGVTIGVATGRAFVGPLGTKKIRRHTITSNAISEASALERMAARYPDCGVMVGGDMIPAIEGYFQYLLLDATGLPGSGGLRRRIASIKGVMTASNRENIAPFLIHTALKMANPLPSTNPFDSMNSCFNAFLEGRIPEVVQRLGEINNYVELSRQVHRMKTSQMAFLPDGRPVLTPLQCDNIAIMVQFISSVGEDVDGRQYRSPLGDLFERAF